ncbi:MAG: hydrogen peroxide-inducible genes activator, partial [Flavobacteriales bacterium]
IADSGSFVEAAGRCFVTQPTLSMQVKKLEDDLEIKLFDRNTHPVELTEMGRDFVVRARRIVQESRALREFVREGKEELSGSLNIAVIPTLSPYLLPLFAGKFLRNNPKIELTITEYTTAEIVHRLRTGQLDAGILATPLQESGIIERPVFYEEFVAYMSKDHPLRKKNVLQASDIDAEEMWVLQEGHCFRNQVLNFCKVKGSGQYSRLHYESGSILALKRMVDAENGLTLLPELAVRDFGKREMDQVRYFKSPAPVREISLITSRFPVKERLLDVLEENIKNAVPVKMRKKGKSKKIDI